MQLSKLFGGIAAAAALAAAGAAGASTTVNVYSGDPSGEIVNLAAGSYAAQYIGPADGGAFDAWNAWGAVDFCNGAGMNCNRGWIYQFLVDFGHGVGNFDRTDLAAGGLSPIAGDNRIYATAGQALAAAQTDLAPFSFTLAAAQAVNFYIGDSRYDDNEGGISLRIVEKVADSSGAPEPGAWALLITGFFAAGAALRRRALAAA